MIKLGKQRAEEEGLPDRFGDFIMRRLSIDKHAREMLESRRLEGVTDYDFLWWWNLSALDRGAILAFDDLMRLSIWDLLQREEGLSEAEATIELRRRVINYGNPGSSSASELGDDRPIPFELRDRVDRWFERSSARPQELAGKLSGSSSMNALIRAEVRVGNL